jgi:hypothetical protein
MKYIDIIREYANEHNTDISSHLETLYSESVKMNPTNIVELGVCTGQSSRAFSYVNLEVGSHVIGVDIENHGYRNIQNSKFVLADDCVYAEEYRKLYGPNIDILFIDTSHLYDHTKKEIAAWFPLLSKKALVFFHDTCLDGKGYKRRNGTTGENWDCKRGVIRPIEEFFGANFDEYTEFEQEFTVGEDKWRIKQDPICNGLAILWKN